jgi:hypothetical protein
LTAAKAACAATDGATATDKTCTCGTATCTNTQFCHSASNT